jgi:hypothetical protein
MGFQFVLNKRKAVEEVKPEPKPQYHCALSGNYYCGGCEIRQCHANILDDKHPSGCLYLFYDNKKQDFDKYDIMYAFNIKDKTYRNLYNEGWEQATGLITLFKILNFLRDKNKNIQCHECGIFSKDDRVCVGGKACKNRQALLQSVFEQSNLRYPELRATIKDIYLLLHYRKGVEEYLRQMKNTVKPSLFSLFGLEPHIYESLLRIPTQTAE